MGKWLLCQQLQGKQKIVLQLKCLGFSIFSNVVFRICRYVNGLATWSGTAGLSGVHLCYYRKASEQLQFGVEVETNFRVQEAVGIIGYQIDLPKADIVFRGMVDTNWTVAAVMEKKLQPLPFTFALSGILNHTKNQFKLGVGLVIGC